MSILLNNDLILIGLCSISVCLITGYCINYYFSPIVISTSYSPPTFNISLDELKEIEIQSEQETDKNLSVDTRELEDLLKEIFTEEEYNQYQAEMLVADNDFSQNLQDIFDAIDIFN
jgi:hypothetical protein